MQKVDMAYEQTKEELHEQYEEQLDFLRTSIELFDQGKQHEAKRIALSLRILLHDRGRSSVSLMTQLGYKNKIKYLDTVHRYDSKNLVSYCGLTSINMNNISGKAVVKFVPKLKPERIKYFNFRIWWEKMVIKDKKCNQFRRKDLILSVSNKDGGAHVDKKLKAEYADLTRFNTIGIGYKMEENNQIGLSMNFKENDYSHDDGFIPLEEIVGNSIRQIAYEFLESIKKLDLM